MSKRGITGLAIGGFVVLGVIAAIVAADRGKPPEEAVVPSGGAAETSDHFSGGSNFVFEQRAFPFEGNIETVEPSHNRRRVVLSAFIPRIEAAFAWDVTQLVETEESKTARSQATGTAPEPKYGKLIGGGTMTGINLSKSHEIDIPVAWPIGDGTTRTSGLWVSDDVYQELSRTKVSTVYVNALRAVKPIVAEHPGVSELVADLERRVKSIESHTDMDLMRAEDELISYEVTVNGEQTTVPAIRAKNWYGTMTVLDDRENPLILAFEFNPPLDGIAAAPEDIEALKGLLSYRVVEMNP